MTLSQPASEATLFPFPGPNGRKQVVTGALLTAVSGLRAILGQSYLQKGSCLKKKKSTCAASFRAVGWGESTQSQQPGHWAGHQASPCPGATMPSLPPFPHSLSQQPRRLDLWPLQLRTPGHLPKRQKRNWRPVGPEAETVSRPRCPSAFPSCGPLCPPRCPSH